MLIQDSNFKVTVQILELIVPGLLNFRNLNLNMILALIQLKDYTLKPIQSPKLLKLFAFQFKYFNFELILLKLLFIILHLVQQEFRIHCITIPFNISILTFFIHFMICLINLRLVFRHRLLKFQSNYFLIFLLFSDFFVKCFYFFHDSFRLLLRCKHEINYNY